MSRYGAFLTEYIDAWNRQDVEALKGFFTDDVLYVDQAIGVHLDKNTVGHFLEQFIGNYSDGFKVTVTYVSEDAEAETFAYEWDAEGVSNTGAKMFIQGVSMIEMSGDKIRRNTDYWDRAHSPKVSNE